METCIASYGLWAVAILKYLLCLRAGFLCLFSVWTHSCSHFFFNWQLLPADCSVTSSLLTQTDAVWTCWLTADHWLQKQKHTFETYSNSTGSHTVHRMNTAYKHYVAGCSWWVNDGRTAAISAAITWLYHAQEMLPMRFQETAQSEPSKQHWNSNADIEDLIKSLFVTKSKLTTNAHLLRICPEDVRRRYVLFFKITSEIITSWESV